MSRIAGLAERWSRPDVFANSRGAVLGNFPHLAGLELSDCGIPYPLSFLKKRVQFPFLLSVSVWVPIFEVIEAKL